MRKSFAFKLYSFWSKYAKFSLPYLYSRPYVYYFCQIFQVLSLFRALRLFRTLEYLIRLAASRLVWAQIFSWIVRKSIDVLQSSTSEFLSFSECLLQSLSICILEWGFLSFRLNKLPTLEPKTFTQFSQRNKNLLTSAESYKDKLGFVKVRYFVTKIGLTYCEKKLF